MPRVAVNAVVDLRLPRQSDEGEQCGDDGFLVHYIFCSVWIKQSYLKLGAKLD